MPAVTVESKPPQAQKGSGSFLATKEHKDVARAAWDPIAPTGALTITAEARNNLCALLWQQLDRNGSGLWFRRIRGRKDAQRFRSRRLGPHRAYRRANDYRRSPK